MTLASQEMTQQAYQRAAGKQEENNGLAVRFFMKAKQDSKATLEAGRPIFVDIPYVEVRIPGDQTTVVVQPVDEKMKQRFPQAWANWERNQSDDDSDIGTPLSEWAQVTRAQVEELRYFGIRTVEHLAAVPDSHAQKLMGLFSLRDKAQAYMIAAEKEAPIEELRQENEALKAQMGEILSELAELKRPKRGRKEVE